jgi:hypothetical protein
MASHDDIIQTSNPTTHDCLTALPPELLSLVLSFLFPNHRPDRAFDATPRDPPCSHPFD